jgi:hypothetical protein
VREGFAGLQISANLPIREGTMGLLDGLLQGLAGGHGGSGGGASLQPRVGGAPGRAKDPVGIAKYRDTPGVSRDAVAFTPPQTEEKAMKTLVIVLTALAVLASGTVPVVWAQTTTKSETKAGPPVKT